MHLKLTAADKTDVGQQREQNEDCAYKRVESSDEGDRALFIVADGMGGYKAGEVASKLTIETISKKLDSFFKPLVDQPTIKLRPVEVEQNLARASADPGAASITRKLSETSVSVAIEEQFSTAIQQAHAAIVHYGEKKDGARGLGSTVTAVLVQNDQAYIANVGDSRTYLFRNNQLIALTKDHSLVAKLVDANQIAREDIYSHPQRNLIYRSLGAGHRKGEVDVFHEVLQAGDKLLLCSDGLWEMVHDTDLEQFLAQSQNPQETCDKLIAQANKNGGEDNITAIVVHLSAL